MAEFFFNFFYSFFYYSLSSRRASLLQDIARRNATYRPAGLAADCPEPSIRTEHILKVVNRLRPVIPSAGFAVEGEMSSLQLPGVPCLPR
jgi:hypothetical protein